MGFAIFEGGVEICHEASWSSLRFDSVKIPLIVCRVPAMGTSAMCTPGYTLMVARENPEYVVKNLNEVQRRALLKSLTDALIRRIALPHCPYRVPYICCLMNNLLYLVFICKSYRVSCCSRKLKCARFAVLATNKLRVNEK